MLLDYNAEAEKVVHDLIESAFKPLPVKPTPDGYVYDPAGPTDSSDLYHGLWCQATKDLKGAMEDLGKARDELVGWRVLALGLAALVLLVVSLNAYGG